MAAVSALAAPASELERARELYQHTDYDGALRVLSGLPDKSAEAQALAGRCYYMKGDPKKASEALQKAVSLSPNDSSYRMWLGRAWGRRAETSSFMTAPGYASKAREAFEKSVELDPRNSEAMSDLFEILEGIRAVKQGMTTSIRDMVGNDLNKITPKTVSDAANAGDAVAITIIRMAGGYIGTGIANLIVILNPDTVVIGGGVAKAGSLLFQAIEDTVSRRVCILPGGRGAVRIVPAELGDEAGAVGVAVWAMKQSART